MQSLGKSVSQIRAMQEKLFAKRKICLNKKQHNQTTTGVYKKIHNDFFKLKQINCTRVDQNK